ncbi:MAG: sugar phosphate isomerase/epimerase [Gemmataceae bacterium]|nr:sugar phosphate isomerase/epimerase [Gemmataceae bacterium]
MNDLTRRQLIGTAALAALATGARGEARADAPFKHMLNSATVMGQKLSAAQLVDLAAKAGYDALEPWVRELEPLDAAARKDVGKRAADKGLSIESAIGFAAWIVDDPAARKKGLEQARRDMDLVLGIGGKRIAAPPVGATEKKAGDLLAVADRYHALCELGRKMGVVPQVELWGFSKTLGRLGETALVAIESGHPQACILADVYHLYKGGSGFAGIPLLGKASMHVFHLNDYPDLPRDKIGDAHRVYPGDGVAPLEKMLRDLRAGGFKGFLSLELFNREYWKQDAEKVARTGLEKMKAVVRKALA